MTFKQTDERRLLILISLFIIFAVFSIRVHGPRVFFVAMGDDEVYFAHARTFALTHDLSYSNIPLETFGSMPDGRVHAARYSIGPGLLLSPFLVVGHAISTAFDPSTPEAAAGVSDTHVLSVCMGSILIGLAGILLLYLFLRCYTSPSASFWAIVLVIFSSPLPYYLFRRPIMAHSSEFFALSAALYTAALLNETSRRMNVLIAGLCCGFIFLCRWLDFPYVIALSVYAYIALRPSGRSFFQPSKKQLLYLLSMALCSGIQLAFWKSLTGYWNPGLEKLHPGAAGDSLLFTMHPWVFTHLFHIFFGPDWGILWLSPVLILTLILLPFSKRNEILRPQYWTLTLFVPSMVLLWMTANWVTHGAEYGHRYLIPVWTFFSVLFAEMMSNADKKGPVLFVRGVLWIGIACLLYSTMMLSLFKSNDSSLTLHIGKSSYGEGVDWVNPLYAWNACIMLMNHPLQSLLTFGSSLAGYGVFSVLNYFHVLPASVQGSAQAYVLKHGMPNCYNFGLILGWLLVGSTFLYYIFRKLLRRNYLV